jgi:hypothetical protein
MVPMCYLAQLCYLGISQLRYISYVRHETGHAVAAVAAAAVGLLMLQSMVMPDQPGLHIIMIR